MSDNPEYQSICYALIALRPTLCKQTPAEAKKLIQAVLSPEQFALMEQVSRENEVFLAQATLGQANLDIK